MPPNTTTNVRKIFFLPVKVMGEVDEWRAQQRPIPSEGEAFRRLIQAGLEVAEQEDGHD